MKCEVCGKKTRINWGNAGVILCEEHLSKVNLFKATDKEPDKKSLGFIARIVLISINLLVIVYFFPFVVMSFLVFQSGFNWEGTFAIAPIIAFPLFLSVCTIYLFLGFFKYTKKRNKNG